VDTQHVHQLLEAVAAELSDNQPETMKNAKCEVQKGLL